MDIRESLEAAFEKSAPEPEKEENEAPGAPESPPVESVAKEPVSGTEPAAEPPKSDEPKAEAKPEASSEVKPEASATESEIKAPVSWTPAERESWNKLPTEAKRAVARREQEIQRGLSSAAQFRKFNDDFRKVIQPYEPILKQEGANPLQAIQSLMNTAASLRNPDAKARADVVAQIVRTYKVDIKALDDALSQIMERAPQLDIESTIQKHLAPINSFIGEVQQTRQQRDQQLSQEAAQKIAEIESREFFPQLAEDIADILDSYARNGRAISLEDAYERAAKLHPDISGVLEQRSAAAKTRAAAGSVSAAERAAGSLKPGAPASVGKTPRTGLRGAIEDAYDNA